LRKANFLNTPYNINDNPHKGNRGITRAWHAAKNSWCGIVYAFLEESAFRQELTLFIFLTPVALFLPVSHFEKALLIASLMMVLVVELLNSSVEAAIDRISFEHHDLSKRAKDFGSAAVMLTLFIAGLLWLTACIPLVFNLQ
jgi:diacylglycerol kinase (ATP)